MRVKNSIRNITISLIGQLLSIVIAFITRQIFIANLNEVYLGINGLFVNIISLLSLTEMGFSTAIVYVMYKPLAENDHNKINYIMKYFSKIYKIIGLIIFILGMGLLPFLKYMINTSESIVNIKILFGLYLLNSSVSYLFSYRRVLLIADQKSYISNIFKYSFFVVLNIVQIMSIIVFKSFLLYIVIQVIFTIIENFLVSKKAKNLYPSCFEKINGQLSLKEIKEIHKNVKAMVYHKLGGVVVNSTDNIIISVFAGIDWVAKCSNYFLIITSLNTIINQIFISITASIGNLNVTSSREKSLEIFNVLFFVNFWIYSFSSVALAGLTNRFIYLWIGEDFILSNNFVYILVLNFYLNGMRKSTLAYRESLGLFWNDRYKPVFESIVNIVFSVYLVKIYGVVGVIMGTCISTITTCLWIEPYILFKYGIESSLSKYFKTYLSYLIITVSMVIIGTTIGNYFTMRNLSVFLIMTITCIVVPNSIILMIFKNSSELKYLKNVVSKLIKTKFN